ncbi:MAG: S-layer homology domain-containing protein [Bacillota bacterium]
MIRRKILSVLLAGLLLFFSALTVNLTRTYADITPEQIEGALSALKKLSRLSQDQAVQALDIAQAVVEKAGIDWLDSDQINSLIGNGLTKNHVITALKSIKAAVTNNWNELTSPVPSTQLAAVANLANQIKNDLNGQGFIDNLEARGITIADLVSATVDLVNIQINSWNNLPREDIEKIIDSYPSNAPLGKDTAAKYGLNWDNIEKILDSLTPGQKDQLRAILISIGSWKTGGGGSGGGAAPVSGTVSESTLNSALELAQTTGKITLQAAASDNKLTLTASQLKKVPASGMPLELVVSGVTFTIDPAVLAALDLSSTGNITFGADKLSPEKAAELTGKGAPGVYKFMGDVYQLTVHDNKGNDIQLNGGIAVTLPVPGAYREAAAAAAANGTLRAGRFNSGAGTWDEVPGDYDGINGVFRFSTDRLSHWSLLAKKVVTFSDISGHWAQKDIEYMANSGYVSGMGGGIFAPGAAITRAQFATLLVNVLKLTVHTEIPFTDVPPGEWYYGSVARAYAAGLVRGISADSFAPEDPITREQMAAMICNALRHKALLEEAADAEGKLAVFADRSSISGWARIPVAQVVNSGIIKGKPLNGTVAFAPLDRATRAEAAVMLKRLVERMK